MKNKWKMNDEVQTKPNLYATGIKFLKFVKTPLNVVLQKTDVINWLLLRVILTSKKEKKSFFQCSCNSQYRLNVIDKGTLQKYHQHIF